MTVKELADKLAKIISEGHGDRETCVYDDGLQVMGVELSALHFDGKHFQQVADAPPTLSFGRVIEGQTIGDKFGDQS